MKKKIIIITLIAIPIIVGVAGLGYFMLNKSGTSTISLSSSKKSSDESDIDWSKYETYDIKLGSGNVNITKAGVYNITGTLKNGSIIINTKKNVKLVLNGVTITSNNSPAIYVKNAKNTYIELVGKNEITSTTTDSLDASIYSSDDLFIYGSGSITINSNKDGIASKDDLTILSGTFNITSDGDGIKGRDSLTIKNGEFVIDAKEDAIKTTNEEKGNLVIEKGSFKLTASKDGIHACGLIEISGGSITIDSMEGLEATYVKINDGDITINASDDGINATKKSTSSDVGIEINGGNVTIKMGQGDTDALDSNGNLYINGGKLTITGQSPFDYDGEAKYSGGTMIINGEETTEITNQFAGGGPGGEEPGGMPNDSMRNNGGRNGENRRR